MQNKKELTASFRRMLRRRSNKTIRQDHALWFTQMDISEGKIFENEQEEQTIGKKLAQQIDDHFSKKILKTRIMQFPRWGYAAAATLFILAFAAFFITNLEKKANSAFKLVTTTSGQRKTIVLSDGSKIVLNNLSSIRFPARFSGNIRKV